MSLYLDTSVLLPQFVHEPCSESIARWFEEAEGPLFVSNLASGEVGSALSRFVRMRRITADAATSIFHDFGIWTEAVAVRAELTRDDLKHAGLLVRRPEPKLLMPDAMHLACALRLDLQLVTLDHGLEETAAVHGAKTVRPC